MLHGMSKSAAMGQAAAAEESTRGLTMMAVAAVRATAAEVAPVVPAARLQVECRDLSRFWTDSSLYVGEAAEVVVAV